MSFRPLSEVNFSRINWILVDVDGVLTDGGIIIGGRDLEFKRFDAKDGHGLALCRRAGLKVGLLTGRYSEAVNRRSRELHLDFCSQGQQDKVQGFEELQREFGFSDVEAAYIGDDLQDAPVLQRCGLAASPADGVTELDAVIHARLSHSGGHGAVREFCELILKEKGAWQGMLKRFSL